jgi:hypothetical protein
MKTLGEQTITIVTPPQNVFTLEEIALHLGIYRCERLSEAAILATDEQIREQEIDLCAELADICAVFGMGRELKVTVVGEYAAEVLGL